VELLCADEQRSDEQLLEFWQRLHGLRLGQLRHSNARDFFEYNRLLLLLIGPFFLLLFFFFDLA
jgi:hypothetical protein